MNNKPQAWKGDTPMRACEALNFEPAACWRRLQQAKHEFFFENLEAQMKDHHQRFLEALMGYERQCFLNAHPYERSDQRVDQANGFYRRRLTTRLGVLDLRVPRTRTGCFHPQVLPRYQRREPVVNEALKQVFLLGVSTRQAGRALATLVEEAWSASTVRAVAHPRCRDHKRRNLENNLNASQGSCLEEANLIYQARHRTAALERFREWKRRWRTQAPKAVACLEADLEELLAFFESPGAHWKRVRTTNVIERLFVEVRRRIRTMCAFTTRSSCERILYSVFDRMNTYW